MRITNQMMNQTAEQTKIPINQMSLAKILNEDTSSGNILNNIPAANAGKQEKSIYEEMEKAADKLAELAGKLTGESSETLFEKAKESGDTGEITSAIQSFVEAYNRTVKALEDGKSTMDTYYLEQLKELAGQHTEGLRTMGITQGKDGLLNVDSNLLTGFSPEALQKAWEGVNSFVTRASYVAGRVAENASANISSLTNQYTASGGLSSSTASSGKYEFWG